MTLDAAWASQWVRHAARLIDAHSEELTALDAAIGDGDHGTNLARGMAAAVDALDVAQDQGHAPSTPAAVVQLCATALISTVGGASGPLLGTAFLRAGAALGGADLDSEAVARFLETAAGAIELRGRAELGDKTMLDAWRPAAQAARQAVGRGCDPAAVFDAAARAAAAGAQETKPLRACKGRASYLGERSRGHVDPGAQSTAYLLQAAAEVAGGTASLSHDPR